MGSEGRYRLSISNPVAADAGTYVCNATNSRGSAFSSTRLVILGRKKDSGFVFSLYDINVRPIDVQSKHW